MPQGIVNVSSSPFSPSRTDGELKISKNLHFGLNSVDLGHDQAAGHGASAEEFNLFLE